MGMVKRDFENHIDDYTVEQIMEMTGCFEEEAIFMKETL